MQSARTTPLFGQITFVGIGLINGSLARDVRRLGLAERLVATTRRSETRDQACALGLVDEAMPDAAAAVRDADLVVLGVPVGASGEAARAIAPGLRADAVVTDVGSAKARVAELVAPHLDMRRFVPGHPVAGTEHSGPAAAIDHLFDGRWCILTPDDDTDPAAVDRVAALWRAVGSRVELMDAAHHDKVLAITSHLPHLLAFNIVNTADDLEGVLKGEILKYAAGGFTDFTRIAASNPTMWRDVFLHNKTAVLEVVGRYIEDLMALQRAIRWDEADTLFKRFESASAVRREVVRAGQAYKRRPIVKLTFAFILGVVPLALATGAGAEMRQSLGTAVLFGMLGVTAFGLVFTPTFYVVLRGMFMRSRRSHSTKINVHTTQIAE